MLPSKQQKLSVMGFQYEPTRSTPCPLNDIPYNDDIDHEISNISERGNNSDWCDCGNCKVMPTSKECLCCTEVDEIKYFRLQGKAKCFTC